MSYNIIKKNCATNTSHVLGSYATRSMALVELQNIYKRYKQQFKRGKKNIYCQRISRTHYNVHATYDGINAGDAYEFWLTKGGN